MNVHLNINTYKIQIVETLIKDVIIKAETESEAKQKVMELYGNSNIVLTADDFADVDFIITKTEN